MNRMFEMLFGGSCITVVKATRWKGQFHSNLHQNSLHMYILILYFSTPIGRIVTIFNTGIKQVALGAVGYNLPSNK